MVALERAGIPVNKYVAYEIDESAIKISNYNYPNIEHCGDVFDADFKQYEGYDLLIGGSPCTFWSIAGNNRETTPDGMGYKLFMEYARALREVKPKWFLYENNYSISDEIRDAITSELGVEPVFINSADFSAQIRKRYYWTNIPIAEWTPCDTVFSDIMDNIDDYEVKSIGKYSDTIRISRDGSAIRWDTSGKGYYSQANKARLPNQKFTAVCASRPDSKSNVWLGGDRYRRSTIEELEKLQTLPVGYTSCISCKEKRGKGIGNGWTINVIAHIFKGLYRGEE